MKRGATLVLILMVLLFSQCRGKSEGASKISIEISSEVADTIPWYLVTYGTTSITTDTLNLDRQGKIKFQSVIDLDTIDFMLIYNALYELQLPIIPVREDDIKIKLGHDLLEAKGIRSIDSLLVWRHLITQSDEEISGELLEFLERFEEKASLMLALDAYNRFGNGSCHQDLKRILEQKARLFSEESTALGLDAFPVYHDHSRFSSWIDVSGENERKEVMKLLDKKPLLAVAHLTLNESDSASMAELKAYYSDLDSLGIPSYTVLLEDSLPSDWKVKKGATFRYFLIDSIGEATRYIQQKQIQQIPSYQLVDSTLEIWRSWSEPDSLIQFIKTYNKSKEEKK